MSEQSRSRGLSFSSEQTVVQRWFGGEILDHSPKSVRMDFMNSGRAPLLMYHDQRQQIGVIEKANIGADRIGHAVARFGRTANATDALANVDDGIMANTSVGYRVHQMVLDSTRDGEDIYRVTDWEPYEASLVGVPADPTVGVGRAAVLPNDAGPPGETSSPTEAAREAASSSPAAVADSVVPPNPATTAVGVRAMTTSVTTTADPNAEPKVTAVQAETQRRQAIQNLCRANKIDARVEQRWIAEGTKLEDSTDNNGAVLERGVASQILDVMEARGRQQPATAAALGLSTRDTNRYSLFRAIRALRYGGQKPRLMEEAAFEIECSNQVGKKLGRELTSSILIPSEVLQRPLGEEAARAMATTPGTAPAATAACNFSSIRAVMVTIAPRLG